MRKAHEKMSMDLDVIRTFIAVEHHGSFAAVARFEGVDPSSISRRIVKLEEGLNLHLFDRTTRRLRLTEAGRIYLDRISPIIDAMDEAEDAARDAVVDPSGLLRITASVAFGERWLTPRLASFRDAYPKIEIELYLTDSVVDITVEGIDVAFRLGPEVEGAFVATKLFDVTYRAVAAPAYLQKKLTPKKLSDLADHDAILFALPRFGPAWRFRTGPNASIEEVRPRRALAISNALAIRRAALDGFGVALLADWTIQEDLENGDLIDLFPNHEGSATQFNTIAWIVYPSRNYVTARLRAFIDHMRRNRSRC